MKCALELRSRREYLERIHGIGCNFLAKTKSRSKRASESAKRRSRTEEPGGEGGPDEAAAFIAETLADLSQLARRHQLDLLDYLLRMAQLEAEEHLRLRSKRKLS
jgi:hypothetical protein